MGYELKKIFVHALIVLSAVFQSSMEKKNTKSEDYVYYSVFWVASRTKMGYPPHFRYIRIYYFDEWQTFEELWYKAWPLVEDANYDVPKYLREPRYVPTNWRSECSPGFKTQGDDYLLYNFGEDAYDHWKEVLPMTSYRNSFFYGDWLYLFIFFYNLCYCMRGKKTDRTCPDACLRPGICRDDPNSLQTCRPIRDPNGAKELHPSHKNRFSEIYSIGYECLCRSGFRFSQKRKKCLQIKAGCNDKRYGRKPCRNKGICETLKEKDQIIKSISFKCTCPPAWQGYVCEAPRNPCKFQQNICGAFPCQRDPTSEALGYRCACSLGYEAKSQTDPSCVNVNECEDEESNPCLNGGICHDLAPPPNSQPKPGEEFRFRCKCQFGFTGYLCERPPAQLTWSEWGTWSPCSVTCGIGTRTRTRICPRPGECAGKPEQTGMCHGRVLSCDGVRNGTSDDDDDDVGTGAKVASKSLEERLREAGVLWSEEDDNFLEDAFTWSEQQFNIRGASKLEKAPEKLTTRVARATEWLPLFGATQRITLQRAAYISGALAFVSLVILLIITVVLITLKPKRLQGSSRTSCKVGFMEKTSPKQD